MPVDANGASVPGLNLGGFPSNYKQFSTFSGADMVCILGNRVFGALQALTYGISREVTGLWTFGSADLRAYSKGKRIITGRLVFLNFDKHALLDAIAEQIDTSQLFTAAANLLANMAESDSTFIERWDSVMNAGTDIDKLWVNLASDGLRYVDQIPPFDITITMRNEYGLDSGLALRGVQLFDEATALSVDDLVTEKTCSFIARSCDPLGFDKIKAKTNKHNIS